MSAHFLYVIYFSLKSCFVYFAVISLLPVKKDSWEFTHFRVIQDVHVFLSSVENKMLNIQGFFSI